MDKVRVVFVCPTQVVFWQMGNMLVFLSKNLSRSVRRILKLQVKSGCQQINYFHYRDATENKAKTREHFFFLKK